MYQFEYWRTLQAKCAPITAESREEVTAVSTCLNCDGVDCDGRGPCPA